MDRVSGQRHLLTGAAFAAAAALFFFTGCGHSGGPTSVGPNGEKHVQLLNVSYDPTRELWVDLNAGFQKEYLASHKIDVGVTMSHGGSGSQARAIIDGNEADVATLALWSDTNAVHKVGLISDGWEGRLPNQSVPYYSTIVFVVRKGNPKGIKDWPDLIKGDTQIVTPTPKTSGNGKLAFVAAWYSVLQRGGSEEDAHAFVKEMYKRTPVLDSGARQATTTFSQKQIGDVHLTWESEAHLEVEEAKGGLEIVVPPTSIRAEPPVTLVDKNVDRRGTREVAEAYLKFVFSPAGQEIVAKHYYRPINDEILAKNADRFPKVELYDVKTSGSEWSELSKRFFDEGGVFDQLYGPKS